MFIWNEKHLDRSANYNGLRNFQDHLEYINKMKRENIQLAMVIGIYLAIALLLVSIIVIVKNIKEIKSDPISYGIEKKGFNICSCYTNDGRSYDYNSTGIVPKTNYLDLSQ